MEEVYRIKKGKLSNEKHTLAIDFGLIFNENGIFLFDLYIKEDVDLNLFMKNEEKEGFIHYYTMTALTDENNEITATKLSIRNIIPHQSKIGMESYGYVEHTTVNGKKEEQDKRLTLFFLEIEGLKMQFSDLTETFRARGGVKLEDFNGWIRDHTRATLVYDGLANVECNNFKFIFFKSEENQNIAVELPNYRNSGENVLYYDTFKEIKRDFVSFLSFINGAEVAIRKEYTGGFYNINSVNSQKVFTYSFKQIKNERHNGYIPLNNIFHRSDNILSTFFLRCFNKYVEINKKLDLNSIIFYLNGAEQAQSIEEKFFIQIIAFERLSRKYLNTLSNSDGYILSDAEYKPIKKDLLEIIKTYETKTGKTYGKLASKVGELNKIKKASTEYKFLKLLEYAKIQLNNDIENIIDEVRHKSIHEGEIGKGNEAMRNHLVLDQLLRDIILNIIEYKDVRKSLLE